jgi:ABC-type nitrate/sulfonate/bicarbonate transport system substrate-binding protein
LNVPVQEGNTVRAGLTKLKKKALTGIVVAAALLSLTLASRASAEPLRLGILRGIQSTLIYIADTQGFFKKRGVDVVIKEYGAGVLALDDFMADRLDIATVAEFVFALQAFKHTELRMPATVCTGSDHELVVRKDSAIARPQDLKGKRIGVVRGSSAEFFLYNYLIFNAIPPGSVRIVYHTPSELVNALVARTIDAALSWSPYTTEMQKRLGATGARWPAQSGQDYYMVLMAKEKFLKNRQKMVEQFLMALSDAETFVAKYPGRAQTILRVRLNIDTESFSAIWSCARFQLQLTQDLLILMEREAKWAMRNKLVESRETPNYLDFFYFEALEKVKPEAVSIVH